MKTCDGQERWILWTDAKGPGGLLVGIGQDVTAQHLKEQTMHEDQARLQEQLARAQRLESVGRLAGGVAHDFNNMLTVIRGYAELMLRKLDADSPYRRYVKGVLDAAERSAQTTQQLLAFSRKQMLEPTTVDVNHSVHETAELLERLIGEDVRLCLRLSPDAGFVRVDDSQLGQILLNLAVNARDAMPRGGKLTIATASVQLDESYTATHLGVEPGVYVMLSFTDTGAGIQPEVQAHIFEPFFTTKEQGKGTGLGLATVYGIVKQSGGSIWVYSEVGRGSTFKIYLPQVSPAQAATADAHDHGTILLIEDEDATRELVTANLHECGYHVLSANGGDHALSLCEDYPDAVDVLLTDMNMAGTNGEDLISYFAARYPRGQVLYMSGLAPDAESLCDGFGGHINYLQKPFHLPDLGTKIAGLLAQARERRSSTLTPG